MKLKFIPIVLLVTILLAACGGPVTTGSQQTAGTARVVGGNIDNQDPQVAEVLFGNNDNLPWRRAMKIAIDSGQQVDVFLDCDDGRCGAGSNHYARIVADGGQEVARIELGTLAGQATDTIIAYLSELVDRGIVRSINVSSHGCVANDWAGCGAGGVKGQVDAGTPIEEFDHHQVGEAARFIRDGGVDAANPGIQAVLQARKISQGVGYRVPVFGWVTDHASQLRYLVSQCLPGVGNCDDAVLWDQGWTWTTDAVLPEGLRSPIARELQELNRASAEILGPRAQEQNLVAGQSFRRVVIKRSIYPAERLIGIPPGQLDQVFNIDLVLSTVYTEAQYQSALAEVRAGLEYAAAHRTPETEVLFVFDDNPLMNRVISDVWSIPAYQSFLSDATMQEMAAYVVDAEGQITKAFLYKPAFVGINPDMVIGPTFRGMMVHGRKVIDGREYAMIHGDATSPFGYTLVTATFPGQFQFARIYPKMEQAEFHLKALQAQDPDHPELYSLEPFEGGAVVFSPDFGSMLVDYLQETGRWNELPKFLAACEERYNQMFVAGFASVDIHTDQCMIGPDDQVMISDWSPNTTLTGDKLKARFSGVAEYVKYFRKNFGRSLEVDAKYFPELAPQLPPRWPTLGERTFQELVGANETALQYEQALTDLGSTQPEIVARGRETMARIGAVDNVIFGEGSVYATSTAPWSTMVTRYPQGDISFVGIFSKRFGPIGFQKAENIPGTFGWTTYFPGLTSWVDRTLGQGAGATFGDLVVVAWVAYETWDTADFAQQTEAMVVFPDETQTLQPTAPANVFWYPPEKFPYVTTRWNISMSNLESGCNGTGIFADPCAGYLPPNVEKPIFLGNALAGETMLQQEWPDYGFGGNRWNDSWSYLRYEDGTFVLWHDDLIVFPGSVMDYYELVATNTVLAWVPYHAEYRTSGCEGLCIQQALGGEILNLADGNVYQVEFCPAPADVNVCWPAKP